MLDVDIIRNFVLFNTYEKLYENFLFDTALNFRIFNLIF